MPLSPHTLILFDIDGTLVNIHGAGRRAFRNTLARVFGWENDLDHISFAGATDLVVLHQLMAEHGHRGTLEDEKRFFAAMPDELRDAMAHSEHTLHPGVHDLLESLSADPRCVVGLVTGNIRACAMIKLEPFGLTRYFRFGGYGDDHPTRAEIARIAVTRAGEYLEAGARFGEVVMIGDALTDIEAARAIGARSIAVTTGWHSREKLLAAGADHLFEDLSQTEEVLSTLDLP